MVFKEFSNVLNTGTNANQLRQLFKQAYLEHKNLADATRFLVNFLFGEYGLVVIDGDDKELKSLFKPYALKELKDKISFEQVSKTNESLKKQDYQIQVNPREINLFYIGNGFRERIIKENGVYKVNNTNLQFTNAEDLFANTDNLEFVSGNALLRPLYQEVILPNLCYIGGGGELAYWMQLKSTFNAFNIPFPMLLLRNSALLISEKQAKKIKKLDLEVHDLFLDTNELKKKLVNHHSEINFSFADKREKIYQTFKELRKVAEKTDKSFIGAVNAQEVKQLKGLDNLEKRLLKAEKKKLSNYMERLDVLHNSLFPKASLEERQRNMSEYYESYGVALINNLHLALNPLEFNFSVIFCENFT